MADEGVTLYWHGLEITVEVSRNWLNTDHHHIEIHCREPLPITNTGYRSHFMLADEFEALPSLEEFVRSWLESESHSKNWKQIWTHRQQLSFGL